MSKSVEKYGLSYIRPFHREMARRLVLGEKESDVKKSMGISDSRFSIIFHSPLFKNEYKKLEAIRDRGVGDIGETLKELSPIALEKIEKTMYFGSTERIQFDAAESILDRAGVGKVTKTQLSGEVNHTYASHTADELRQLVVERVKKMREEKELLERQEIENSAPIEVDYIEVVNKESGFDKEIGFGRPE